ncbi:hypothetical protein U14_02617 [Candidatus Moduliflexus flocculans]|uniref:Uncharacterized protein n=1 Tax=Candidatus Moduliflexus flocculans TaxID=1499966 RepID=A0A081BLV8_9BACT|nr:hypothetical protein U14_02617 [Candidatus Moduliflexus flocculans]
MTNYEQLFQEQMQNPEFVTAYHEARIERRVDEMLSALKEKICHDEPKENLLNMIDSIQQQIHRIRKNSNPPRRSQKVAAMKS